MPWYVGLVTFLAGLPKVADFFNRIVDTVEKLNKAAEDKDLARFLDDLDATTDKIERAQTLGERVAAARALSELLKRLR